MTGRLPDRLVISGVPGAGKSCFVDWLVPSNRFFALKADEDTDKFQVNAILSDASRGHADRIKAFGALHPRLVIEIGYQPEEYWASAIRTMCAARFEAWWFDADHDAALRAFVSRKGNADGFEPQWGKIAARRLQIEALYGNHIIKTLSDGSRHMSPEEIAAVLAQR